MNAIEIRDLSKSFRGMYAVYLPLGLANMLAKMLEKQAQMSGKKL